MSTLERVFESLDAWRHLPAYQLERRADIFFAMFLPDALSQHFNRPIKRNVIPEFPIATAAQAAAIAAGVKAGAPNKVDFFALSQDGEAAFLVELKTDMASKRSNQDSRLNEAAGRSLEDLVRHIMAFAKNSSDKGKYGHLLCHLQQLELVEGVSDSIIGLSGRKYTGALNDVRPTAGKCKNIHVVYVQPRKPNEDVIGFCAFAETIERIVDGTTEEGEFARLFARYIREWAWKNAGSPG